MFTSRDLPRTIDQIQFQPASCTRATQPRPAFYCCVVVERRGSMRLKSLVLAVLLCLIATTPAFSQATADGAVVGVVTDASGAAIPGATVTASNKASNTERSTTTNSAGEYRFDLLPPGSYVIRAVASGFSSTATSPLSLQVGSTITANMPLQPGGVNTTIEVQASNVLLDAEKTDSSTNVTPQQVQDLPINGRDFANLA